MFDNAAEGMSDLGANVFVRHVKTIDEDPWWPSGAPLGPNGERLFDEDCTNVMTCNDPIECPDGIGEVPVPSGTDLPAEFVADADAHGMGMIAYYWQQTNRRVAQTNPEWVCHTYAGEVNEHRTKGPIVDYGATGYGDIVKTHLVELAETGVQGFYFDGSRDPVGGCRTAAADAAFTAATGLQPPTAGDITDPVYHAWINFRTDQRIARFQEWRDAVRAVQPEAVFVVSVTNLPALTLLDTSTSRWAEAVDAFKTEYHIPIRPGRVGNVFDNVPDLARPDPDVQLSLGWATLRDLSDNAPHNWTNQLPNTEHVLGTVGSMAAHGHIANLDVPEDNIFEQTDPSNTPRDALIAGFDLGNQISPYLADKTAERWAAVHFSESQRDARMIGQPNRRSALVAAWEEVLWPLTGAYGVLARAGVPTGVVTDAGLTADGLDGYRLLFLPHRGELTAAQEAAVDAWEAAGGVVIENDPAWQWADPEENEAAHTALAQTVAPNLDDAQVRVTDGPETLYAGAFTPRDGTGGANPLTVAITNDFTFVERVPADAPPEDIPPAPPAASGVEVAWHSEESEQAPVFEAVSRQWLVPQATSDGYMVSVPDFQAMALLAVPELPDGTLYCFDFENDVAGQEPAFVDPQRPIDRERGTFTVEEGGFAGSKSMVVDQVAAEQYRLESIVPEGDTTTKYSVKIKPEQTDAALDFHLANDDSTNEAIRLTFAINGLIRVTAGDGSHTNLMSYSAGQWYEIDITVDLANQTYDLDIDGTRLLTGESFRHPTASIETVGWRARSGMGTFWIDDVCGRTTF